LQLDKFKLTKWFKNILQIAFSDAEMDITHIKPVKWNLVRITAGCFGVADLTVLFGFRELGNDGNS
jgi:hypothetical protein